MTPKRLNLNLLIQDNRKEFKRPIPKGVLLQTSLSRFLPMVDADEAQIVTVVQNLIENAVRYGDRARVTLDRDSDQVRVVVDDDGPGIPEANHEEVFQPFVRLEQSRSRETGGAGLGLAIARSIVRGHGGDITRLNRAERGLHATLTIPLG